MLEERRLLREICERLDKLLQMVEEGNLALDDLPGISSAIDAVIEVVRDSEDRVKRTIEKRN